MRSMELPIETQLYTVEVTREKYSRPNRAVNFDSGLSDAELVAFALAFLARLLTINVASFDLRDLVEGAVESVARTSAARGLEVRLHLRPFRATGASRGDWECWRSGEAYCYQSQSEIALLVRRRTLLYNWHA